MSGTAIQWHFDRLSDRAVFVGGNGGIAVDARVERVICGHCRGAGAQFALSKFRDSAEGAGEIRAEIVAYDLFLALSLMMEANRRNR